MTTAMPQPTRPDSTMNVTQTLVTHLATADQRFVAHFDHEVRCYRLWDRKANRVVADLLINVNEVKRKVADIVDYEHRLAVQAYTRDLAVTDPQVGQRVRKMRRDAAAHGRVTGAVGLYWRETDADGRELAVYVDRSEYAALLAD